MKDEAHQSDLKQEPWIAAPVISALNGLGLYSACVAGAMGFVILANQGFTPSELGRSYDSIAITFAQVSIVLCLSYTGYLAAARASTRVGAMPFSAAFFF